VKLARFRMQKVAYFLSYVKDRSNTNIRNIIYKYKYIQNIFQNMKMLDKTKGGGKEKGMVDNESN
jgi:hypothetical protein